MVADTFWLALRVILLTVTFFLHFVVNYFHISYNFFFCKTNQYMLKEWLRADFSQTYYGIHHKLYLLVKAADISNTKMHKNEDSARAGDDLVNNIQIYKFLDCQVSYWHVRKKMGYKLLKSSNLSSKCLLGIWILTFLFLR